jgi:hypothetical protein
MIILALLLLVAWSQIRLWIRYVPIGDLWLVEFSLTQPASNIQTVETIPTPVQLPTAIINDGTQSIIVSVYRLVYLSPDWLPEGFSATQIPGPGYSYEDSIGMWSNEAEETIRLFVVPQQGERRMLPGNVQEVQVKGQPAILIFK